MEGVRDATADDGPRLSDLFEAALRHLSPFRGSDIFAIREARPAPAGDALRAAIEDPARRVVVGTIDDVVVGYAIAHVEQLRDGRSLGVIDDVFVEEDARGVAVGEAMMGALMPWFEEQGCLGVDAFALPGDRNTKNFFETNGFVARLIRVHHRFGS